MEGGTDVCSFLNFSNAFLFISSFCTGSVDETVTSSRSKHPCACRYNRGKLRFLCELTESLQVLSFVDDVFGRPLHAAGGVRVHIVSNNLPPSKHETCFIDTQVPD